MRSCIILATLLVCGSISYSQAQQVKGSIQSIDTADLSILQIFSDSFPNISVVFKAESRSGDPVWGLTSDKMRAKENELECEVISLEPLSANNPIYLGIVVDHSGSMEYDASQWIAPDGSYYHYGPVDYKTPLSIAQEAIGRFVKSFDAKKDMIAITGFSDSVKEQLPLTRDVVLIDSVVQKMRVDGGTALYDAMIAGIKQLDDAKGMRVLITLTDGMDNMSAAKWKDVVNASIEADVPLYIIGLGGVDKTKLELMAKSTKGQFYYASKAATIDSAYAAISKKIQAFYKLVYVSHNIASADSTRTVELSFDIDSIFLVTDKASLALPYGVREALKAEESKSQMLYGGATAVLLILSAGALVFFYRGKEQLPEIGKVYPNPASSMVTVEHNLKSGRLEVTDMTGREVLRITFSGSEKSFDLSALDNGEYVIVLQHAGKYSNARKVMISK